MTMIGCRSGADCARMRWATLNPSRSGMRQSSRITSNSARSGAAAANAAVPLDTASTCQPKPLAMSVRLRRTRSWSSAISTRRACAGSASSAGAGATANGMTK
ncbi:hypothetical protein NB689_002110 [Xanthomonas sacchari]|nr:hypothetical protein [Xanthomonas sacchari]